LTFNATSSASKSVIKAGEFAANKANPLSESKENRIVLVIKCKTGKDISGVVAEHFKHEQEVLVPKGRAFKILSNRPGAVDGVEVTFVDLVEI
jgi:hypothetical protein